MKFYTILDLQEQLQKKLKPKRYMHTLGVQYTAANIAMCYQYDIEKAQIAALLHDCAKYLSDEKMLEKCQKYNINMSETEKEHPYLLHAKLGAYFAQTKYQIEDKEILGAITYHTTGKPEMNLLEKIVFVADYMEPGRPTINGLQEIRFQTYQDLDRAVYLILKNTLDYLKNNQNAIDETTKIAYDYYNSWKGEL